LKANEALVFDRNAYDSKRPFLFYCKAEFPLPHFRVGSDSMWRLYYKHMVRRTTAASTHEILNSLKVARDKPTEVIKPKRTKKATNVIRVERPPLSSLPPFM